MMMMMMMISSILVTIFLPSPLGQRSWYCFGIVCNFVTLFVC